MIPEIGDGELEAQYELKDDHNREVGKDARTAKSFGRYSTPRHKLRRPGDASGDEQGDDGTGYTRRAHSGIRVWRPPIERQRALRWCARRQWRD
jgi:hypothetical protein